MNEAHCSQADNKLNTDMLFYRPNICHMIYINRCLLNRSVLKCEFTIKNHNDHTLFTCIIINQCGQIM